MQAYGYTLGSETDAKLGSTIFLDFTVDPEKVALAEIQGPNDYCPAEQGVFLLHPKMPGEAPTSVTFKSLGLQGHSRFFTRMEVRHPQAGPVVYRVMGKQSDSGTVLFDERTTVSHGKMTTWQFDFPAASGPVDVMLSIEMAPDSPSNFYAWSHWVSPRFLVK